MHLYLSIDAATSTGYLIFTSHLGLATSYMFYFKSNRKSRVDFISTSHLAEHLITCIICVMSVQLNLVALRVTAKLGEISDDP